MRCWRSRTCACASGEHVVDVGALRLVTRPDLPRLTHKAVAVLIELVRHVGKTVTRDELLDRVWVGRMTTPDVLTQAIKELRRAFADDSRPSQYIETIPKVGYRLIAPVLVLDGPDGGIFIERCGQIHGERRLGRRRARRLRGMDVARPSQRAGIASRTGLGRGVALACSA